MGLLAFLRRAFAPAPCSVCGKVWGTPDDQPEVGETEAVTFVTAPLIGCPGCGRRVVQRP